MASAQQRPGLSPRRHRGSSSGQSRAKNAQQRPGLSPRRHPPAAPVPMRSRRTSTKAGALTPATHRRHHGGQPHPRRSTKAGALTPATLPGRLVVVGVDGLRSTKAGALTPATLRVTLGGRTVNQAAQQRPGLSPRRHSPCAGRPRSSSSTLNKGRGSHPGDTGCGAHHPRPASRRSTKAGALTPATRGGVVRVGRLLHRSTKAGALTPATLLFPAKTGFLRANRQLWRKYSPRKRRACRQLGRHGRPGTP